MVGNENIVKKNLSLSKVNNDDKVDQSENLSSICSPFNDSNIGNIESKMKNIIGFCNNSESFNSVSDFNHIQNEIELDSDLQINTKCSDDQIEIIEQSNSLTNSILNPSSDKDKTEAIINDIDLSSYETRPLFSDCTCVYFYPNNDEYTIPVFYDQIMKTKGSDASWANDVEPPPEVGTFCNIYVYIVLIFSNYIFSSMCIFSYKSEVIKRFALLFILCKIFIFN